MKVKLPLFLSIFITFSLSAQVIYVSSGDAELFKLDINNCTYEFVVQVQAQVYDITFHPNGNLYGIEGDGDFYQIDTLTGSATYIYDLNGQTFNSLTTAGNGLIYITGNIGELWSYDVSTDDLIYYGDIGYNPTGDLTFYDGNLYAAVSQDRIVQIDIDNPQNSFVIIDQDVLGSVFGIVSYAEDCNNFNCYAIGSEFYSAIYQIDFQNNSLEVVCELDFAIGGGASTFEFFASAPIEVIDVSSNNPGCDLTNGEISVEAIGGTGQISYSIDGQNFQTSGLFENLLAGNYELLISDENGCSITEELELSISNSNLNFDVTANSLNCANSTGSIVVSANDSTDQLLYSIDGLNFQANNAFEELEAGTYTLTVKDDNNCSVNESIDILLYENLQISLVQAQPDECYKSNGAIEVEGIGGRPPYKYSIDGVNFHTSNVFLNLIGGDYVLKVQDSQECIDSIMVDLDVIGIPNIYETRTIVGYCDNYYGEVWIEAIGENLEYSIDGQNFQSLNVFENLPFGDYTFIVQDAHGCQDMESLSIEPVDNERLKSIKVQFALCGESNGSIVFDAIEGDFEISANGDGFFQENIFVSQGSAFTIENLSPGFYDLEMLNEYGCISDTTIQINQAECPINIPNAFSPNDDGLNDQFRLLPHPDFAGELESFSVFNRWGTKVYETQNFAFQNSGWDGTFNGEKMEMGVYIFNLEYISKTGEAKLLSGNVTLVK